MENKINIEILQKVFKEKGYSFFINDTKNYNLNIIGVRSNSLIPNKFDDLIIVCWKYKNNWELKLYKATTDPGLYYLQNPLNIEGTAILIPDQYKNCYELSYHTDYEALRQISPMKYWRDRNKDGKFDFSGKVYEEIALTNLHKASKTGVSTQVDKWSAGCQVVASSADFTELIGLVKESKNNFGNKFTYTLITEKDLDNAI